MTRLTVLLAVAALALAAAAAAVPAGGRTVPCGEAIDQTRFPYAGGAQPRHRYRLVLGAISVPPAYLPEIEETGSRPWTHWRKAGLVVRAGGQPVTIAVPRAWRTRAAIDWGNAGHGPFDTIRFAGCAGDPATGNAYAGGFVLRTPTACLPLIVRVGARTATVRFGLGKRCP